MPQTQKRGERQNQGDTQAPPGMRQVRRGAGEEKRKRGEAEEEEGG